MKKTLFCLAVAALLLAGPRVSRADVSVDFFYNNLSGGSWIDVGDYGYCWQPDVAVSNNSWRPYADGYWAYTDLGWTWVSYEDFGWATYHYGRWARLSDIGWVWVPGRDADLEWGPAWVSWRTGGEYIGWAPLPPETIALVESRPLTGHLDVEFNIGPEYYNFVDVRYIGEPVLRERIVAPTENITYIQQTVNVTNITYKNRTVYNYGPDVNVINRTAARPIQRLRLDREQNVDVATAAKTGGLTKVQGDRLVVAAPMRVNRAAQQVAPRSVKTKVAAAKIDRGWSAVGDEKAQAEFKQRIRSQDLKNIPPPTPRGAAQTNAAAQTNGVNRTNAAASASPAVGPSASPSVGSSNAAAVGAAANAAATHNANEENQGRQQEKRGRAPGRGANGPTAATTASPEESAETNAFSQQGGTSAGGGQGRRDRGQAGQRNRFPQSGNEDATATSGGSPTDTNSAAAAPRAGVPPQTSTGQNVQPTTERQGRRGQNDPSATMSQSGSAEEASTLQTRDRRGRQMPNVPAETAPGDLAGQGGGPRRQQGQGTGSEVRRGKGQGQTQKQDQGEERGPGQGRGGKHGQGEGTPAPTP